MTLEEKPLSPGAGGGAREARAPAWLASALVAAGLLAIVVTLSVCSYLPFQDVPNHIKVLTLDRALRAGATSPFLEAAPGTAFGYSLVAAVSRFLAPLMGAATVVRLLCIVSAAGIPLAAVPLARVTGAPPAWAALLALPLALSWPLRVGLLPYVVALPLVELGLAAALWAGQGGRLRRVLALAGCAVASYLAHPMVFGLLAGLAGVTSVLPAPGAMGRKERVLRVALGLGVVAPLVGLDLLQHRLSMLPDADATLLRSPVWWRPLPLALGHVITRGLGVTGPDALVYYEPFLLVLVVGTAVAWRPPAKGATPSGRRAIAAAALLGTLGTVLLPDSRENVFLIGSRVAVLGILFWTAVAAPALAQLPWLRLAAVPAVALALGFQIHEVAGRAAMLREVLGPQPEQVGGLYLPMQVPRCQGASSLAWGDYDPLRHAWAYALDHDGVAPYIFAGSRYQPVWFRPGVLNDELRAPKEHLLNGNEDYRSPEACELNAQERLAAANAWAGSYDDILVTGREPELGEALGRSGLAVGRTLAPGLVLVRRSGARSGLRVEFGRLAGTAALRSGFYGDEIIDGLSGQWSEGKASVLAFTEDHRSHDYLLRLVAQSPVVSSIAVTVNGGYEATIPVGKTPSETVAYVPGGAINLGKNELRLSYARTFFPAEPLASGPPRELSVLYRDLFLSPLAETVSLDVGTARGRKALVSGFSEDEVMNDRTAAWSDGKESVVVLDVAGGATEYLLTLRGRAAQSQAVSVSFNDRWTGAFQVEEAWGDWSLAVPGSAVLPGRNTLRFSYASPARPVDRGLGDDARLLAVAFDTLTLAPAPARVQVDCGVPEARGALRSGFSQPETIDGRRAVWSDGKSSEVVLSAAGEPVAHVLTIEATARSPQRATITWNGGHESPIVVAPPWSAVSVVVPAGVVRPGFNTLQITYESPGHPDGDSRLLAVAYHELTLEPIRPYGRVEFGTPAGRRELRVGWSGDEVIDGRSAVWSSGPWSEIEIALEPSLLGGGGGGDAAVSDAGAPEYDASQATLDFTALPLEPLAPLPVEVRVNDRLLAKVIVVTGWQSYTVPVPKDVLRSGFNSIRWTYERVGRPRDLLPGNSDARALALAFHDVWLR